VELGVRGYRVAMTTTRDLTEDALAPVLADDPPDGPRGDEPPTADTTASKRRPPFRNCRGELTWLD
jgi:hypothetical protein